MAKKKSGNPTDKQAKKKPAKKKPRPRRLAKKPTRNEPQRLQRVLAHAGYGSRRECEAFIEEGRVEVGGKIVTKLGTKVDPYEQKIFVDGVKLKLPKLKYFALNKPPGIVSTAKDPSGRLRVIDLIKSDQRVYNVGRLDQSSEGLILVTNDGELANQLTHPSFGVSKKYLVQVAGRPSPTKLKSLIEGVYLAEGKARVKNIKFKRKTKDTSWLEIVLDEGRNREIRRLLARVGHKVLRLRRIAIGPLLLGTLPLGAHRQLTFEEIMALKAAVSGGPKKRRRKSSGVKSESSRDRRGRASGKPAGKKRTSGKKSTRKKSGRKFEASSGRSEARSKNSSDKTSGKKRPSKKKSGSRPSKRAASGARKRGDKKRGTKKRGRK